MFKLKFNNHEYTVIFKQGLEHNKEEVKFEVFYDLKEIFINTNISIAELEKIVNAIAFRIVLLENRVTSSIDCEDINKISSVLADSFEAIKDVRSSLSGAMCGYFCNSLTK